MYRQNRNTLGYGLLTQGKISNSDSTEVTGTPVLIPKPCSSENRESSVEYQDVFKKSILYLQYYYMLLDFLQERVKDIIKTLMLEKTQHDLRKELHATDHAVIPKMNDHKGVV